MCDCLNSVSYWRENRFELFLFYTWMHSKVLERGKTPIRPVGYQLRYFLTGWLAIIGSFCPPAGGVRVAIATGAIFAIQGLLK